MKSKGQFDFVWMFAIIVGGAILFLAIYGAMKTGDTMRFQTDTEAAKQISTMTDPLHAGFADGASGKIVARQETRINNVCLSGGFGRNEISVSTRSEIGKPWNSPGAPTSVYNKYFFSRTQDSGLVFYVFSKPFDFPYKVSDLIFITSDNYCFMGAPEEIAAEIVGMNIKNIEADNCTLLNPINVCFGSSGDGCDIRVSGSCNSGCNSLYDMGVVTTTAGPMNYVGNLMYAAIFSDKEIYDCNVERLMYRDSKIAEEFVAKTDLMNARGCRTNLRGDLAAWSSRTANATSANLGDLRLISNDMDKANNEELCGVW